MFFRNMYRDHGSSVNAYRAVSIEPAQYNGHLRVSVWFETMPMNHDCCLKCVVAIVSPSPNLTNSPL